MIGSSPRMRGTLPGNQRRVRILGIIPADAGNTLESRRENGRQGDHPRGCGEHTAHRRLKNSSRGSSPRMRGTPQVLLSVSLGQRIIPADAGNTCRWRRTGRCTSDHPRGCGEHQLAANRSAGLRGSSPRMRGTPDVVAISEVLDRIIPADAGNTRRSKAW